ATTKLLSTAFILFCLTISFNSIVYGQDSSEHSPQDWYESITAYRISYSSQLQDLKLIRDAGHFEFKSGRLDIIESVRGRYHTVVFEGEGLFKLDPPTQIERNQLKKFTKSERLEERFEKAVLSFTDNTAEEFMAALGIELTDGALENQESKTCKESRKRILRQYQRNIDSRLLEDIASGGMGYFIADIASKSKGKFIYEIDPHSREEVSLWQFKQAPREIVDVWCSFHFADQYEGVLPVRDKRVDLIEIPHFEVDLTLKKNGNMKAIVILDCVSLKKSVMSIPFTISKLVNVDEVLDDQGRPCFFVHEKARDRIGEPPLKQQELVVVLPSPLQKGEQKKLTISYHSEEIINLEQDVYSIRDTTIWYPNYGYLSRSSSKMTYRIPPDLQIVSVGTKTREWEENGNKCSTWEQNIPVAAICFNYGDLRHYRVAMEELPPVDVYASGLRIDATSMHNMGADVFNSLNLFQRLFSPYPFSSIIVTEIPWSYGQGFPGFLHLGHFSFRDEVYSGINEAFKGHEVSHQWWGHLVGWETYHDQWLSEGFAEYSGALFAQMTLADKNKKLFERIVEDWKDDILNRGSRAFVRYGFPKLDKRLTMGSESGPIWLGTRLSSSKSPLDYNILVYEKGAYVIHMLRMMMRDFKEKNDDKFFAMIKDFIETYEWRNATTEGFRRIVEKHMRIDMKWFFDQWIYGTDIPTYKFKW
ncbi:M1 family aminopeptidase, partial [Acidobacteriota bacterium]